jgi:hypothetical protein
MRGKLDAKAERLWSRYWDIIEGRANGFARPIAWREALRGRAWAMLEMSARFANAGPLSSQSSSSGLARRALRLGHPWGAQYLTMDALNSGDLTNYRHWLIQAARAGDDEARLKLKRFETRLTHADAPPGHRRPFRRGELDAWRARGSQDQAS